MSDNTGDGVSDNGNQRPLASRYGTKSVVATKDRLSGKSVTNRIGLETPFPEMSVTARILKHDIIHILLTSADGTLHSCETSAPAFSVATIDRS